MLIDPTFHFGGVAQVCGGSDLLLKVSEVAGGLEERVGVFLAGALLGCAALLVSGRCCRRRRRRCCSRLLCGWSSPRFA